MLKSSNVCVSALVEPGDNDPEPIGGATSPPMSASAFAIAVATAAGAIAP